MKNKLALKLFIVNCFIMLDFITQPLVKSLEPSPFHSLLLYSNYFDIHCSHFILLQSRICLICLEVVRDWDNVLPEHQGALAGVLLFIVMRLCLV